MSETADDDEDLEHPRFIRMRAEDTFDGQERVFTRAAYDLQVQATAHSQAPWPLVFSVRPEKMGAIVRSSPSSAARYSLSPPGKRKVACSGTLVP